MATPEELERESAGTRHAIGSANAHARLTISDINAIRNDRRRQVDIAEDYGIVQQHVSRIKRLKEWKHVPDWLHMIVGDELP